MFILSLTLGFCHIPCVFVFSSTKLRKKTGTPKQMKEKYNTFFCFCIFNSIKRLLIAFRVLIFDKRFSFSHVGWHKSTLARRLACRM